MTAPQPKNRSLPPPGGSTIFQSLMATIVIALFVITFIVQAFQIPSESMEKTLLVGDYLLVDKIHFAEGGFWKWILPYRDIRRADIVVFHYPVDPSQHFVKRMIGLPGDHIRLRDKFVYVNGKLLTESYALHNVIEHDSYRDDFPGSQDFTGNVNNRWRLEMNQHVQAGELVVPPGQYFVLGDNRDHSLDSRYWGFVPRKAIVGRPLVIYFSLRETSPDDAPGTDDKSFMAHSWQIARWNRMFHLVR